MNLHIMDESINLNLGLAYHKIPESSVHDLFSVDTLQSMDGFLANIKPADITTQTYARDFLSYGVEINHGSNSNTTL